MGREKTIYIMPRFGILISIVLFSTSPLAAKIHEPDCVISYNEELHDNLKFDTVTDGNPVTLTVHGSPNCQLRALVVGGGGQAFSGNGYGGGSGYIMYGKKAISSSSQQILVEVGDGGNGTYHGQGQPSSLSFLNSVNSSPLWEVI